MLKMMRDSFQHLKWILVFIVFLFVLFVFAQWGAGGAGDRSANVQSYAARVNGETISMRDYNRALYLTEQQYRQAYGQDLTEEMRQQLGLPKQVLASLVDETLLLQQARKLGLSATPDEVRKKILQIPDLNPNGKFVGAELYERYVTASLGYPSPSDFEAVIARELTLQKIQSALMSSVVIPPQVAEAEYRRQSESARIRYVLFPTDRVLTSVAVTPAETEAYYKAHPDKYTHPEQRDVTYLLADEARIRAQVAIPETELRKQYEQTKDAFKANESVHAYHILLRVDPRDPNANDAAQKAKAEALVAKLRAGADFATVARENSQDPGSSANGGDLGFFERGRMVAEFEKAAFSLPVGQISDPVKTQFGYHIIKVVEKKAPHAKTFEEVRDELETRLREQRAKEQAQQRITEIHARIGQIKSVNEATLRNMATDVVSYNDSQWFGKNDPMKGLGRVPELITWAASAKPGDVGAVMETRRGPVIPYLKGVRPAGVSPFAEVQADAEQDAKLEKARQVAKSQLASAMAGSGNVDQVAAKLGLTAADANLTHDGTIPGLQGGTEPLVEAAFKAPVGQEAGPVVVDQGAVAFQVVEQTKFDPAKFAQQQQNFTDSLRRNEAMKLRKSLLEQLRSTSKIDLNQQIMTGATDRAPAQQG